MSHEIKIIINKDNNLFEDRIDENILGQKSFFILYLCPNFINIRLIFIVIILYFLYYSRII